MSDDKMHDLMLKVNDYVEQSEFRDKAIKKRYDEFVKEHGRMDTDNIIKFSQEESSYYTRNFLVFLLNELYEDGYLNKK